jgi:hypothetical protein
LRFVILLFVDVGAALGAMERRRVERFSEFVPRSLLAVPHTTLSTVIEPIPPHDTRAHTRRKRTYGRRHSSGLEGFELLNDFLPVRGGLVDHLSRLLPRRDLQAES